MYAIRSYYALGGEESSLAGEKVRIEGAVQGAEDFRVGRLQTDLYRAGEAREEPGRLPVDKVGLGFEVEMEVRRLARQQPQQGMPPLRREVEGRVEYPDLGDAGLDKEVEFGFQAPGREVADAAVAAGVVVV